jgi:HEPN domain-containing protein
VDGKIENVQNIISYWKNSSDQDYATMHHLMESKDHHWALFIGHLVLEKLLKAIYVSKHQKHALFTHDLLRLSEKADIKLDGEWTEWYLGGQLTGQVYYKEGKLDGECKWWNELIL